MPIPGNFLSAVTESIDPNTSGWWAPLNATLGRGINGRNGDGNLAVISSAAGEMRAMTVSAYPVTVGTIYEAFADAGGGTVPERIGIRWLSGTNIELSTTWSMTTATASPYWHRIAVAGPAPAYAVRAQVVLSSTPAAANVISYFENVYLGLPIRTLGNLLDFNTESLEVDASGWAVDANCTIARQVPAVTWPVDYYLAGGHTLALTVTANGNASAKTAAAAPASAGREYVAFGYLSPPTSSASCWIELRYVNASGTQLSAQRSTLDAPSTGWMRQIASAKAPAGTTGVIVAAGITSGTASQVMYVDSVAVMDVTSVTASGLLGALPAGTVMPFADAEFEQGIGAWTVTSGSATLARSSPWGGTAWRNAYSLKATFAAAGTSVLQSGIYPVTVATGDSWGGTFSLHVPGTGWSVTPDLIWRDSGGTIIATTPPASVPLASTAWWTISVDRPAPAGAASVALRVTVTAPGAGSVYVDSASVLPSLPDTTAEVHADTASVTVTARNLDTTRLMSLWRVTDFDGVRQLVRGQSGLIDHSPITAETLIVEDYEAPLGAPFHYTYETYDATTGAVNGTDTWESVTIPAGDLNLVWLKDPGNPQRNCQVMVQTAPDWTRPISQAEYVVRGRRNKVILSGTRQGLQGTLTIWTQSDAERSRLHWLLDSGTVLLWQAVPGMGVADMYVNVGEVIEGRAGGSALDVWRVWSLPLTEADMPEATGVNGAAGRTWQDVLTQFTTWQDVLSTYATWEDVLLDQRMG